MDEGLIDWLASVSRDPLAFALGAFPWGEPGYLATAQLEPWQELVLTMIRDGLLTVDQAIQIAVASGHGVGKSALVAIIILWAFTTSPDCRGVITANTETQLKTKTWAELGRWFNMFIGRDSFDLTATALLAKDPSRQRTWRIDAIAWNEKNPAAFQGLHNRGNRLLLVMDEASEIPDIIHEVAEGAMTDSDTEIIWLMFGNPTKNSGRFREAFTGGRFAKFWQTFQLDSRTVSITNKRRFEGWVEAYGEDSDFVRVRVKGEFPRQGFFEFFSAAEIDEAMSREITVSPYEPLALGVDVARYGQNNSVIFPRKGRDARSIPRESFNGLSTVELAQRVFETQSRLRANGLMVDETGVGGGVVDNLRHMHLFVFGVMFNAKNTVDLAAYGAQGERYGNMRAGMHGALRAWLKGGALPPDPKLREAMLAIRATYNSRDEIVLIPKEDILEDNPDLDLDSLDALCLTFAYQLAALPVGAGSEGPHKPLVETEWDPYAPERMVA